MKEVERLVRLLFISLRTLVSFVNTEMIRKPGPDRFEVVALCGSGG